MAPESALGFFDSRYEIRDWAAGVGVDGCDADAEGGEGAGAAGNGVGLVDGEGGESGEGRVTAGEIGCWHDCCFDKKEGG